MELIDRSPSRDTPWDPLVQNTATMFGTRAVNPILAAVMCDRINRPDIWPQSLRSETAFRLLPAGGRPHMGPGSRPGRQSLIRRQRNLIVDQRVQRGLDVDLGVDDAGLLQRDAGGEDGVALRRADPAGGQ